MEEIEIKPSPENDIEKRVSLLEKEVKDLKQSIKLERIENVLSVGISVVYSLLGKDYLSLVVKKTGTRISLRVVDVPLPDGPIREDIPFEVDEGKGAWFFIKGGGNV